jgi:glutamate synthase domain-containing protein 3
MLRKCHTNTCPAGVATQDPRCRARFQGRPEHLVTYFHFVAEELREIMAGLGVRRVSELVGRADLLRPRRDVEHAKAAKLDFGKVLRRARPVRGSREVHCVLRQDHGLDDILDRRLIAQCAPALEKKKPVQLSHAIRNINRTCGTMLSGEIAKRYGDEGLAEDTIVLNLSGSAGQSFGAFGMRGLTMILEGDANDYIGKGLSGAKIVVRPPAGSAFDPADNVIVGNVALYGATSGEVYFGGLAGERFAIRNSGARAVVEGTGDHCCEYMTGGVVVVLGRTGVNFAAGMSGGIAFVYDPHQDFDLRANLDMVDIEPVTDREDVALLRRMIESHVHYTSSPKGRELLINWEETLSLMVKVMPMEYRRALGKMAQEDLESRRTDAEQVRPA